MRRLLLLAFTASLALAVGVVAALASPPGPMPSPTGERAQGQSLLEAVFNAEHRGQVGYVKTPNGTVPATPNTPIPANPKSWSPIYVVEYPTTKTFPTNGSGENGPFNCIHDEGNGTDNCPTHGDILAGLAKDCPPLPALTGSLSCADSSVKAAVDGVYSGGVAGHDHVMDFPGGADWNVAWEPIFVLFTDSTYANSHRLLTDTEIGNAVAAGDAIAIPLPSATFHCSLVSGSVWANSSEPVSG